MKVSEFDYSYPPELIAQTPSEKRDHSRLMVLDRSNKTIKNELFFQIIGHLNPGDLLVLNDTKVIPANIVGVKEGGSAKVEVLLAKLMEPATKRRGSIWECLVKPGKRLSIGSRAVFGDGEVIGKVLEKLPSGEQIIEFNGDLEKFIKKSGEIPLPPYIEKQKTDSGKRQAETRYQTVYAKKEGASAAPTAGLHFTPELLDKIKAKGIDIAYVTLHTGLATFRPVYAENVEEHKMYKESFEVPIETIAALKKAKRVIAVGTTSVRTLESIADKLPTDERIKGETDMFIYPGYKFKIVNAMITNFHFPRSTLLMLVSAFAGKDLIFKAYKEARDLGYRFFSFGDAMLIL